MVVLGEWSTKTGVHPTCGGDDDDGIPCKSVWGGRCGIVVVVVVVAATFRANFTPAVPCATHTYTFILPLSPLSKLHK